MTTVYFVRHASPDLSVKDETLRPLSGEGREQADRLVRSFAKVSIDKFYSSPAVRARATLEPLAIARARGIQTLDGFHERRIGTWVEDFTSYSLRQWTDFNYKLDSGESLSQTQERNLAALQIVLRDARNATCLVGTHGTALSTIIDHFAGSFGYEGFSSVVRIMPLVVGFKFDKLRYVDHTIFRSSNSPGWEVPVW